VLAASIRALITPMMEVANTSETVNFYQTTLRNIPEDIHLHYYLSFSHKLPMFVKMNNTNKTLG
jgi:hypothetical protein